MSIVIVGGHDRMVGQYKKICKSYKCKCKVFTQMEADFGKKIGCPDLLVLFTNTVSHKMVKCALDEVGASTDIVSISVIWVSPFSVSPPIFCSFSCIYCII